jgi:hypothetical protein
VETMPGRNPRVGANFVTNPLRSLHRRPARAATLAVLLAVTAAATTACGGADADPDTIARAKQAYAAAKAAAWT